MSFLDDFDPLGGPMATSSSTPAPKKSKKKPVRVDSDDDEPAPAPAVKKSKKKVVVESSSDSSSSDSDDEPLPPKKKKKAAKHQEVAPPLPPPAPVVIAAVPATAAGAPVKKKKKKVVESSSSSSSSSSSDSSDDEDQSRRKKKSVAAAGGVKKAAPVPAPAPAPALAPPSGKKGHAPQTQAQPVQPQLMDLFDFGDFASPPPPPAATTVASKSTRSPVVAADSDSSDTDSSDDEPPPPKKKKKSSKKSSAPVEEPAPRVAAKQRSSHGQADPVPATSMASFLGDETEEALEGFNELEVSRPPKKKTTTARRDVGLDEPQDDDDGYGESNGHPHVQSPGSGSGGASISSPVGTSVNGRKKAPSDWRIDFENTSTSLGMNKNIVTWNFVWKRQVHEVVLHHSTFGGKRKIIVDDRIRVQEKKPFADASRYDMRIGEGPLSVAIGVQIKAAGLTAFTYELFIEKMPYDRAQQYWLTHPEV